MYSENDFRLYHHGIRGMHWGDKNGPPYPLDAAISTGKRLKTAAASAANKVRETAGKIKEHRAQQAEIKAAKKQEKAEAEAVKKEAEKQKAIEDAVKSGRKDTIEKYSADMSVQQFNEAVQRAELNKRLANTETSAFDKAVKIAQNVANLTNSASNIYNNITSIQKKIEDADEARTKKEEDAKAKKIQAKEQKWIRKASPEDFLNNESKMSTAALKERKEREDYKERIEKRIKVEDRSAPPKPTYVNKDPVNNHKESTWTRDEGNSFWNASYRKLGDSEVEVLSGDVVDSGRRSFNNAIALLEDKSRK